MTAEFTYDDDTYSDLYKDCYGFRPRNTAWFSMTPAEKQVEWDRLIAVLSEETERMERGYNRAAVRFEERVAKTIAAGAKDRATALRWIYQADCGDYAGYDWDYLCFHNGLRYGYFKEAA